MNDPFCSFVRSHYANGTQVVPLTSQRPRRHPRVSLRVDLEENSGAKLPGDWLLSKTLGLLLDMGLLAEGCKEKQQGTAPGFPGGSPFISLGTFGPLGREISPWVPETRAQGPEETGTPYCPFFSRAGSAVTHTRTHVAFIFP